MNPTEEELACNLHEYPRPKARLYMLQFRHKTPGLWSSAPRWKPITFSRFPLCVRPTYMPASYRFIDMFVTQYRTKCCDERTGPTCLPASYRFIAQSPFLPDQSPFETIGRSLSSACTIQSVRLLSWTRTSLSVPILGEAWQFHSRIRQPRGVLAQSD